MLKLNEFSHNHHPPRVKMLAKYIRRGISVIQIPAVYNIFIIGRQQNIYN